MNEFDNRRFELLLWLGAGNGVSKLALTFAGERSYGCE